MGMTTLVMLKVPRTNVTAAGVAALQKALPNCQIEWDDPGQSNKPWNTPAFQQWMNTVAALPADKQVEAVTKKLQQLNPGFDGKLAGGNGKDVSMIRNGVVEEVKFFTDNVTDISPLRVFGKLKLLRCSPKFPNRSKLSDLSPIEGMPLRLFECNYSKISDLSPLRGMPLTILSCESTPIADLSPLRDMPLADFNCENTQVSDLSPLKGMPLTKLHCYNTQVSDLSLFQGMNLVEISITPKNITKGMDVIRQMKSLKRIEIGWRDSDKFSVDEFWKKYDAGEFGKPKTTLDDPAFQQWMKDVAALPAERQSEAVAAKLQALNPGFDGRVSGRVADGVVREFGFDTDNVVDISPVRALAGLKWLRCGGSAIGKGKLTDLSPLAGMTLTSIDCYHNPALADLSPLAGMPLGTLRCSNTPVSNLSPLRGMKLVRINLVATHVSDLSPLAGMQPIELDLRFTDVTDLTPLAGMNLNYVGVQPNHIAKGLSVLRGMSNLKSICIDSQQPLPAAEFWKKYDAGEFGKPNGTLDDPAFQQWMKDVAALPAEQQAQAVAKKLQDLNPGFDGQVSKSIDKGVVISFGFKSSDVSDFSPIRALSRLQSLQMFASGNGRGNISDLSPLAGMNLSSLACIGGHVTDLAPLRGMPLTSLDCGYNDLSSLAPLEGMSLTDVRFGKNKVTDLGPLAACR